MHPAQPRHLAARLNYKNFKFTRLWRCGNTTEQCGNKHSTLHRLSLRPAPASIRLTEEVQALDGLEGTENGGQEQLCDPLVPAATFWYLSAAPELMAVAAERLEAGR